MAEEIRKMGEEELGDITGGGSGLAGGRYGEPMKDISGDQGMHTASAGSNWKTVAGIQTGYLAIRSVAAYNDSNIIGQLNNGDVVRIVGDGVATGNSYDPFYSYVYSPRLDLVGYVNSNFLQ